MSEARAVLLVMMTEVGAQSEHPSSRHFLECSDWGDCGLLGRPYFGRILTCSYRDIHPRILLRN